MWKGTIVLKICKIEFSQTVGDLALHFICEFIQFKHNNKSKDLTKTRICPYLVHKNITRNGQTNRRSKMDQSSL
jgi:hypothetical protein